MTLAYDTIVVDSLEYLIQTAEEDTVKINALSALAWELKDNNPNEAIRLSTRAQEIIYDAENSGTNDPMIFFKKASAKSHFISGELNRLIGSYPLSLEHFNKANKIYKQLNEKRGISSILGSIGLVYLNQSDYPNALEYLLNALTAYEELEYKPGIAIHLGNIGLVYFEQGDYVNALEYNLKALKMRQELGSKELIASTLGNIGSIYSSRGNSAISSGDSVFAMTEMYPKALEYFFKALKICNKLGNQRRVAAALGNIGSVYHDQGDYLKGLEYYFKALKISEELEYKNHTSFCLSSIGTLYAEQKNYPEGERYLLRALELSTEIASLDLIKAHYEKLSILYEQSGQYQSSFEYYDLFHQMYDSIYNEQNGKQIAEIQTKYANEKKERKIKLLKTQEQLNNVEFSKQRTIKNAIIGSLVLMLILTLLVYNRFTIKKATNEQLKSKNETIGIQKTNIIDSINYASRIQESILVNKADVLENFPKSFIYYQPKDIVSGDFYWCYRHNEKSVVAVVDCTGHGVPGAFMSIIGNTLMNEIVIERKELDAGKILTKLHLGISKSLHQDEDSDQQDGMDMSLCVIDHERNLIQFSGAKNPMYIIDGADHPELEEIPADPYSIGEELLLGAKDEIRKFSTREIEIREGMTLYLFTDGYMDQFGDTDNSKFSKAKFKEMLFQNHKLEMTQQGEVISQTMKEWKGNKMQIDDMLVMGIRV